MKDKRAEELLHRKLSKHLKQLADWADAIALSSRTTRKKHERIGTVPELFTAERSNEASPLEAANSNEHIDQPAAGITEGSDEASPLEAADGAKVISLLRRPMPLAQTCLDLKRSRQSTTGKPRMTTKVEPVE